MLNQNLEISSLEAANKLRRVYSEMIDGTVLILGGYNLWEKIDKVWEKLPEIKFSQGRYSGVINSEDVSYFLGPNGGYSIFVELKTPYGKKNIKLHSINGRPRFSFSPL